MLEVDTMKPNFTDRKVRSEKVDDPSKITHKARCGARIEPRVME